MIRYIKFFIALCLSQQNTPNWLKLSIDLLISVVSFSLAFFTIKSFYFINLDVSSYLYPLSFVFLVRLISFIATKSYKGIIRYTSTHDAVRIFFAVAIGTIPILIAETALFLYTGVHIIEPPIIIIDSFILILFISGFRISFKILHNRYAPFDKNINKKEIIIYGAGQAGIIVKRSFEQQSQHGRKVIAFLDDNTKLQGQTAEGVNIYRPEVDFDTITSERDNLIVILAINNISALRKKRIIETCLENNIEIKTIPPVDTWIDGKFNVQSIKPTRIEDLLERDPIELSSKNIKKELKNQVILITGAAGSIGSEIARQCIRFDPKEIILIDQAETPLYELQNELNHLDNIRMIIGDVCNESRMDDVFAQYQPSYVFHAAAYKHVPLMEEHPYEAINTNVFGTQNLANISVKYGIKKFVFVSTDKAVNPTNIMGASKRIAEIFIQSLNSRLNLVSDSHTMFVTTRFGNVLGSNGSVIPLFKKQIELGGPLTVTHRNITRFFMTIPEACQLVLEAGVMGAGGEIYIFDMGEPVKIVDLARKMISLSGLKEGKDITIKFTGLRPGEKLKEELLNDKENTIGTYNPKIMVAKVPDYNYLETNELISDLYKQKDILKNRMLVKIMKHIVPEYISNNSVYEELDKKFIDS